MRNLYLLFLIVSCAVKPPIISPPVDPGGADTVWISDTVRITPGQVSVKDFGAKCDGVTDDIIADSVACMFCALNPKICNTVTFPVGTSRISRPLKIETPGKFVTVNLKGFRPAKSAAEPILSQIYCDYTEGPGISVQLGRGVVIENLFIKGRYRFPDRVTNANIGTYKFADWIEPGIVDSRYNPYAGISIDPHENADGSRGGSSDLTIKNCLIRYFMVGVCLTPNSTTLNDEMINIIDCNIELVRVAIAIGQDQSKTILISGLKVWGSTHTVLDGLTYGRGTGGGSVFCENWNVAGNVNQLFFLLNDRFPLSAKDIYSESIFRLGTLGGPAGANCINFQIDFLYQPGWPAADYLISGRANFYGGSIRYYDGDIYHRPNLVNSSGIYRDLVLGNLPITVGLYGVPQNVYPVPILDNVHLYYPGKMVYDTLFRVYPQLITVDRVKWTAIITGVTGLKIGDYILGAPNGKYYDQAQNGNRCPTFQIGRVVSISGNSASLQEVALNVYEGLDYDGIFVSRLK